MNTAMISLTVDRKVMRKLERVAKASGFSVSTAATFFLQQGCKQLSSRRRRGVAGNRDKNGIVSA
jgi:hypothetical protein